MFGLLPVTVCGADVYIVTSRESGIHDAIARETSKELARKLPAATGIHVIHPDKESQVTSGANKDDIIIAVGTQAYSAMLESNTQARIIATLIPRATYLALTQRHGRANGLSTAVFIEQSFRRNLDLVKIALPGRTAGVLVGSRSDELYRNVQSYQQQNTLGIYLKRLGRNDNLISALEQVLSRSKVFIAYADPEVSNRTTAQHILLTSYRHGVPVIAYSRAYVRAGAMMAVYSKPEQYARQAADIARDTLVNNMSLPTPQFPKYFSVEINTSVARSLNIRLKSAPEIERQLRSMAVAGE